MSLIYFLSSQILAHLLTDFIFQNDKLAKDKNTNGFKSRFLIWHVLIAIITSWILFPSVQFIIPALAIGILHYIIDGLKPIVTKLNKIGRYAFYIDQVLHIATILTIGYIMDFGQNQSLLWAISPDLLMITTAIIALAKPTNIIIRELFKLYEVEATADTDELPKGGRLIGTLERWLVLIFVVTSHFSAIGFLIAAKSILRYKDTDTLKTEYVLIGTMLSFGSAIALGFGLLHLLSQ
ncbi:DUF3307 domain-containing protein [Jiulongibacter sp. NS-SX5]|uniref:DUF3307 domain-containing protein n=1 Tax=Jiulongibacter sp. NS-SX5 TaxID=3463854 RepID=UPI00405904A1